MSLTELNTAVTSQAVFKVLVMPKAIFNLLLMSQIVLNILVKSQAVFIVPRMPQAFNTLMTSAATFLMNIFSF